MSYLTPVAFKRHDDIYGGRSDKKVRSVIENIHLVVFGAGVGSGVWVSVKFCALLNSIRTPRYYQRRARRLSRGEW